MTMKKIILTTVLTISAMMLWSCGQHNSEASSINGDNDMDSTLCQFSNIDAEKMFYYIDSRHSGPRLSMARNAPSSSRLYSEP